MATITCATLTIPTPQPYDDKMPQQQLENVCYVLLQLFQQAKTAGVVIDDQRFATIATAISNLSLSVPPADLEGVEQAIRDLLYTNLRLDIGGVKIVVYGRENIGVIL